MTTATRALEQLRSEYRGAWWSLVLRGLLSVAVGALIIWRPVQSIAAIALLIAFWAFVEGIVGIVHAFDLRSVFSQWWVLLLSGIVSVGFGIAAFYYYPAVSLAFIVLWVVTWLIITGAIATYVSVQERHLSIPGWGWTMAFGIVSIVIGVSAAMYPPATLVGFLGAVSAICFVRGVVLLYAAYRLSAAKDEVGATFHRASPV